MNFEVETGTGSETATSYATVAQYKSYWADRGTTITDSDEAIQGYLNLATEFLDANYNFQGDVSTNTQALYWPRFNCYTKYGHLLSANVIPNEVINSVCYLGAQAKDGKLNIIERGIKSESFGPVSKTYARSSTSFGFDYIESQLKNYLVYGNGLQRVN